MPKEDKGHVVQDDLQKSLVHDRPQPNTSPPKPRTTSNNSNNASGNSGSSGGKK